MLQSLDILSIQVQTFVNNKRVRRTQSLVEFTGIDSKTGYIRINELYRWDPISDTFVKTGDSYTLNKVMVSRGWDRKRLAEELDNRVRILTYLCEKNMRDYVRISLVVQAYDANPDGVIDAIEADNLQTMIEQNM
jgi:flagellar protein FlaI